MEAKSKSDIVKVVLMIVNVVAVVLLVIGIVQLGRSVFKTVAFDKYPLAQYEMVQPTKDGDVAISEEEQNTTRKLRMMEDYAGALSLLLVAGGMFWVNKKYNKA